jgi:hypothetical protein
LSTEPPTFSTVSHVRRHAVAEKGIPGYLTSVVSSNLSWIEDEDARESIWSAAGARLSERSGRTAMPTMVRSFLVSEQLSISLHEPSLTEDNLGFKTWTSSLLLSQRLAGCREFIPHACSRVLELGAGTGLTGISAACIWSTHVVLTDLPDIIPNLERNLRENRKLIDDSHGSAETRALDWADETDMPRHEKEKFMVILAADAIYSTEHPKLLADTVRRWICWDHRARFVIELPLRDRYDREREELRQNLHDHGFGLIVEGIDTGYDDWHARDGNLAEVQCWWSIWKPSGDVD